MSLQDAERKLLEGVHSPRSLVSIDVLDLERKLECVAAFTLVSGGSSKVGLCSRCVVDAVAPFFLCLSRALIA